MAPSPPDRRRRRRTGLVALIALYVGCVAALTLGAPQTTLAKLTDQASVGGNRLTTAASFCGPSTLSFLTGFEYGPISGLGPFDAVTTVGGAPTIDSTTKRSGTYSARIVKTTLGSSSIVKAAVAPAVTARVAIQLETLPAANLAQLLSLTANTGSNLAIRFNVTTRKLELALGSTVAVSTSTVTAGSWYVIDLRLDASSGTRTAAWRINGTDQPSASVTEAAGTVATLVLGSPTTLDAFSARYDDVALSTSSSAYPLADGRVLPLSPNTSPTAGHSTIGSFAYDDNTAADADAYKRLSEVPLSASSSYVKQTVTGAGAYLQIGFADVTGSGCVNGVQALVALHAAGTQANHASTRVRDATTETVVHNTSIGATSLQYARAVVTPNGGKWTASSLNEVVARIGYSTDVSPLPYWDALLLEYDTTS